MAKISCHINFKVGHWWLSGDSSKAEKDDRRLHPTAAFSDMAIYGNCPRRRQHSGVLPGRLRGAEIARQ